jgi:hypothetical protein
MTRHHAPTSTLRSRARRVLRGGVVTAAAVALPVLGVPAVASAAPTASTTPSATAAATWLAHQFNSSGYIPEKPGGAAPDYSDTEQALVALASTGPDTAVKGTASKALTYLEAHARAASRATVNGKAVVDPGLDAFLLLAAHALGANPRKFGDLDLVTRLLSTIRTSGSAKGLFGVASPTYDGAYREGVALAALAGAGGVARSQVAPAISWTQKQECLDGAWEAYRTNTAARCAQRDPATYSGPDTNSTALAVEGLQAWNATIPHNALGFLEALQNRDGGWSYYGGSPSDADSTSVVRQALVALHAAHLAKLTKSGGTPASLLASYQITSGASKGALAYEPDDDALSANLLATEQAVPAIELRAFPFKVS